MNSEIKKYILLDRDGVINIDSRYVTSPDDWQAIPGSLEAIARLNSAGYEVVVITNQSGIARGMFSLATLDAIHTKMRFELSKYGGRILDIFYCPHHPDANCICRKPLPGMLLSFAKKYGVDLAKVIMVGDRIKDAEAAIAADAVPHFVATNYAEEFTKGIFANIPVHADLSSFVDYLLAESER
jgi:D-glycero-D-manno-heptose 1,7-bisphosphate phosphatase